METLLFDRNRYRSLYGCDQLTPEEWSKQGEAHLVLGMFSLMSGIIFTGLYTPVLIVLKTKLFWKNSCYKILFFYGLMDQVGILLNCWVGGIMAIGGYVFCRMPTLVYVCGCCGTFAWGSQLVASILLAVNRCIDLWKHDLTLSLFDSFRTYVWLLVPIGYGFYCMFRFPPLVFTSLGPAWMANPYHGLNFTQNETAYKTFYDASINLSLLALLVVMVVILVVLLICKAYLDTDEHESAYNFHKMVTLISICFCGLLTVPVLGAYIMDHCYSSFLSNSVILVVCQLNNGIPCLVFMFVNDRIRDNVLNLIPHEWYADPQSARVVYVQSRLYHGSPTEMQNPRHSTLGQHAEMARQSNPQPAVRIIYPSVR